MVRYNITQLSLFEHQLVFRLAQGKIRVFQLLEETFLGSRVDSDVIPLADKAVRDVKSIEAIFFTDSIEGELAKDDIELELEVTILRWLLLY